MSRRTVDRKAEACPRRWLTSASMLNAVSSFAMSIKDDAAVILKHPMNQIYSMYM